jgi:hypothetical protein
MTNIGSLIEYSGIGISLFILILTNPEIWQGNKRVLARWFIIVPLPFFIGLIFLLYSCYSCYQNSITIELLGWINIINGTILLFMIYVYFLISNVAAKHVSKILIWFGEHLLSKGLSIGASAQKAENRLKNISKL